MNARLRSPFASLALSFALIAVVGACGGSADIAATATNDATPSESSNSAEMPTEEAGSESSVEPDPAPTAAPSLPSASVVIDGETYQFDPIHCDLSPIADYNVDGVITFEGQPTFVEVRLSSDSGFVFLYVGLESLVGLDSPQDRMDQGLTAQWNLEFEASGIEAYTDTDLRVVGEFEKSVIFSDGSPALAASIEANCPM